MIEQWLGHNAMDHTFESRLQEGCQWSWIMTWLKGWPSCLVHPSVRDKRRMTEIDLSQPRHATAFCLRHNWPVTSQLTDRIKWPNHPLDLIGINMHINTQQRILGTKMSYIDKCTTVFYILVYIHMVWVLMDDKHYFASQITVTASP